jgi:hypothetical protein
MFMLQITDCSVPLSKVDHGALVDLLVTILPLTSTNSEVVKNCEDEATFPSSGDGGSGVRG